MIIGIIIVFKTETISDKFLYAFLIIFRYFLKIHHYSKSMLVCNSLFKNSIKTISDLQYEIMEKNM